MSAIPFTRWIREIDGPGLVLSLERPDRSLAEWIELDVRALPGRPDLLCRLGLKSRQRLLADAERSITAGAGSWRCFEPAVLTRYQPEQK